MAGQETQHSVGTEMAGQETQHSVGTEMAGQETQHSVGTEKAGQETQHLEVNTSCRTAHGVLGFNEGRERERVCGTAAVVAKLGVPSDPAPDSPDSRLSPVVAKLGVPSDPAPDSPDSRLSPGLGAAATRCSLHERGRRSKWLPPGG